MLLAPDESCVIDHLGWGEDFGRLWRYDVARGTEEALDLFPGGFRLYESFDRSLVLVVERDRLTVRPVADVESVLGSASWSAGGWEFSSWPEPWDRVPSYVTTLPDGRGVVELRHVVPDDPVADPLDWFWQGDYDFGYQTLGLPVPVPVPGAALVVLPVQRDSRPALYDPQRRRVVAYLELADRSGNPTPYFRRHASDVWTVDYDTVVRLRAGTWERLGAVRLQEALPGTGAFVGSLWFAPDERVCVVSRPFSADVVALDPSSLDIVGRAPTPGQPLDAVLLRDGTVVARDWKSRALLSTHL
jgi:hypothetical protein